MQYSKLVALFAYLAVNHVAAAPLEGATDPGTPVDFGDAGTGTFDGSSTVYPADHPNDPAEVDCSYKGIGYHPAPDQATLLAGWNNYKNEVDKSGGPYLSGAASTVFHTNEYDWSEMRQGKGDKSGHSYCDPCITAGIGNGSSSITCHVSNLPIEVSSFLDTMMLGTKP